MSRIQTLHLHNLEASMPTKPTNRGLALGLTVGVVLLGGAGLLFLSDRAPSKVGEAPAGIEPANSVSATVESPVATPGAETTGLAEPSTVPLAMLAVPAGTKMMLEIVEPATSADATVGTQVVATLAAPIMVDDRVAVQSGARVLGHVTETEQPKTPVESAVKGVAFDSIEVNGQATPIAALLNGSVDLAPGRVLEIQLSQAVDVPADQG